MSRLCDRKDTFLTDWCCLNQCTFCSSRCTGCLHSSHFQRTHLGAFRPYTLHTVSKWTRRHLQSHRAFFWCPLSALRRKDARGGVTCWVIHVSLAKSLCGVVRVLLKNSVMASAARLVALLGAHLGAAAAAATRATLQVVLNQRLQSVVRCQVQVR